LLAEAEGAVVPAPGDGADRQVGKLRELAGDEAPREVGVDVEAVAQGSRQ
jgi:hypothetical protein